MAIVSRIMLFAFLALCSFPAICAEVAPPPKPPEDVSAEIIKCDINSCQISDRLLGSLAGLPGCLVDLTSGDGQKLVRQVDNFRKPGTKLIASGEAKVQYHAWLDETQTRGASILGFFKTHMEKNDRLEVKSTMIPGVSVLPEDLDYARIAAVFRNMPKAEADKYGIIMGVVVYEVSGAIYNTSNRKIDVDWPCYALAGGKSLLYKAGEETSKCFLMAVYAPVPFCVDLQELATTPPLIQGNNDTGSQNGGKTGSLSTGIPDTKAPMDYSKITSSGLMIEALLRTYLDTNKPRVTIADAPRAVFAPEIK